MSYTFHAAYDNFATTVAAPRSSGASTVTLSDASKLTSFPVYLSFARGPDGPTQTQVTILEATSKSGNVVTVSGPVGSWADAALQIGDIVEVRPTAESVMELQTAINSIQIAVGASLASSTPQGVLYVDSGGHLAEDPTNLYYNSTNHTLVTPGIKVSGSPTNGYVLTSDVNGVGTWQAARVAVGGSLTGGSAGRVLYDAGGTVGESAGLTTDGNRLTIQSTNADANFDALVIHNTSGVVGKYSSLVFESNGNSSAYIRAFRDNAGTGYDTELIFGTATTAALGTPAERLRINSGGGIGINTGSTTIGAQLHVVSSGAGTPGLFIDLAPSQSADALQIKNASANVLARVGSTGNLSTDGAITTGNFGATNGTVIINGTGGVLYFYAFGSSTNISWNNGLSLNGDAGNPVQVRAPLQVYSPAASSVASTIQLAASQTADAVQVKNSGGTVLAKIDSAGNVAAGNVAAGNVVGSTFSTGTALGDKFSLYDGGSSNWYGFGIDPGAIYFKLGAGKYFTFSVGGGFTCGAASIGGLVSAGAISLGAGAGSRIKLYDTNGPNDAGLGINMGQAGNAMGFYIANADNFTIERAAVNESYPFPSGILTAVTVSGSTGNMGIGTILPAGKLHVQTTAAVPCGILQLAASQSADALQVRDSSGNVLASISATGTISSGNGNHSERFGASSSVSTSINSTAIGDSAVAGSSSVHNATAIGHSASAAQEQSTAIGASATCTQAYSVAIGFGASAASGAVAIGVGVSATVSTIAIGYSSSSGNASTALGYGAAAGGGTGLSVAVGTSAVATNNGVAIGWNGSCSGMDSVAIGLLTNVSHATAIGLGRAATSSATNQLVLGGSAASGYPINMITLPGATPLSPSTVPNNTLFLDSTNSNKLSWKDSSGTTNPLY